MPIQEVRDLGGAPIKSWGIDVEESAWEQMRNISLLPFIHEHVAMMPDAHPGYGMPIGGVMAADGFVVPYAIGVDIGCGVVLYETGLDVQELDAADIKAIMDRVRRDVPVGNGPNGSHQYGDGMADEWGHQEASDRILPFLERADAQLGTLGGGNHFLELQYGVDDGKVYFMLHSGSRSLGKRTCDLHVKVAQEQAKEWGIRLPHKDVAYLSLATDEGKAYMEDMRFCMDWAVENRRRMGVAVVAAIKKVTGTAARVKADCHHNFAALENHGGKNVVVHRKGAVRARADDIVLIPGSMSTGSFIGRGLSNPDTFDTCQHGAGRLRSRAATKRLMLEQGTTIEDLMGDVYLNSAGDVSDESAVAYKDIYAVMDASEDLVKTLQQLKPLGVVKG
jgi:tRNA-splicing ligase RtcB